MSAAFAFPVCVLGVALATVWLSASSSDPGQGPMAFVPWAPHASADIAAATLDIPPATTLEKISPIEAELRNALIPYSQVPLLLASTFQPGINGESASVAQGCLTSAVYYEAGNEPVAGKRAVAQVVINRWASAPFPKTICGVVQQGAPRAGCQFTFECDGSLARKPNDESWAQAQSVAQAAIAGSVDFDVGAATHYHADYVVPTWATTMFKLVKVGHHIFYRWPGAKPGVIAALAPPTTEPVVATQPDSAAATTATAAPQLAVPSANEAFEQPSTTAPLAAPVTVSPSAAPQNPSIPVPSAPPPRALPPRRAMPDQSLRNGPI